MNMRPAYFIADDKATEEVKRVALSLLDMHCQSNIDIPRLQSERCAGVRDDMLRNVKDMAKRKLIDLISNTIIVKEEEDQFIGILRFTASIHLPYVADAKVHQVLGEYQRACKELTDVTIRLRNKQFEIQRLHMQLNKLKHPWYIKFYAWLWS